MEGKLHVYFSAKHLNVFEFWPLPYDTIQRPPNPENVLLFIGGLFDTFNTPEYVGTIAELFPIHQQQKWRLMHVQLSSTIRGWGISDIDRDIEEIGRCVEYIRQLYGKNTNVVLMGHSTGCQDTMHYLTAPNPHPKKPVRPQVQGAIFQAPVSDREGVLDAVNQSPESKKAYEKCIKMIEETPENERRNIILPINLLRGLFGPAPVSMSRFLSLASPNSPENPSSEDFFSSDLLDARLKDTFGTIKTNGVLTNSSGRPSILILISDADEHMPASVDKQQMLARWKKFVEDGGSSCHPSSNSIPNAIHDVSGDDLACREARLVTVRGAILNYLENVVGDTGESAWKIYEEGKQRINAEKQQNQFMERDMGGLKL